MSRKKKSAADATATSADVLAAIRKRYSSASGWALLEEVRNGTGWRANRSADAVAVGLWPSRGMEIHGFEVKVSRGDWIRERDKPDKAESIARYTDRWWVVVSDAAIVADGEIPPPWGLLALDAAGSLHTVKEAALVAARPLDRHFVAAMLRRAAETEERLLREHVSPEDVARKIDDALSKDDAERRRLWEAECQRELIDLRWRMEWAVRFEAETGIDPKEGWRWGSIKSLVEILRQVESAKGTGTINNVEWLAHDLDLNVQSMTNTIAKLREARAELEPLLPRKKDDAA